MNRSELKRLTTVANGVAIDVGQRAMLFEPLGEKYRQDSQGQRARTDDQGCDVLNGMVSVNGAGFQS